MNIVAVLWEGRVLDLKKKKINVCYAFLLWKTRVTRHFERTAVATYRPQARLFFVVFFFLQL